MARDGWRTAAVILVMAASVTEGAEGQMCVGSAHPTKLVIELTAVDGPHPNLDARIFGRRLFAEAGVGRTRNLVEFRYDSDTSGDYLAERTSRRNEARAGVGWRKPMAGGEACVKGSLSWSQPTSATEDRYHLDDSGQILDFQRGVKVPAPTGDIFTIRGAIALGAEVKPDWHYGIELFAHQRRLSDPGAAHERFAEGGVVAATSVLLAKRLQLRTAVSWVVWDNVEGSGDTQLWTSSSIAVLF